jgi:hypothetical protein
MSATVRAMRWVLIILLRPKRLAALLAGAIVAVLNVWVAAVRAVPAVRRRKATAREAWRRRDRERRGRG